MKSEKPTEVIYKEVIVIGNGPSGIILSFMLSGNIPYITSDFHPDEMLSARLRPLVGQCLLNQDFKHLSAGLEGRTTNPMALLMDALQHPCADMGLEIGPLVEFRKVGNKIDHIVLGKGPPGGSWHRMDPHILTLSLGSWMEFPNLPFPYKEKRAQASNVAKYYAQYIEQMELSKHFENNVVVSLVEPINNESTLLTEGKTKCELNNWVKKINNDLVENPKVCIEPELEEKSEERSCFISNAINCLMKNRKKNRCKRPREQIPDSKPIRKHVHTNQDRSISLCCDPNNICDSYYSKSFNDSKSVSDNISSYSLRNTCSLNFNSVPLSYDLTYCDSNAQWTVHTVDLKTGVQTTYCCKYLVLATGGSDIPNRLQISKTKEDPDWLVYDLRSLETKLDDYMRCQQAEDIKPVLVIGAGLSAADAIIATRGRNIPVIHVFRNKSTDLLTQLPENLYPEYHKVHQMMKDGGSSCPLYNAYPEYNLTDIDEDKHTITLTSNDGQEVNLSVSFAVVLIGSRPDLSFLPSDISLGIRKDFPIDSKTNPVNIDKFTYEVNGCSNLFAIGPLVGDNIVRFLPGGALAVVSELYQRNKYN